MKMIALFACTICLSFVSCQKQLATTNQPDPVRLPVTSTEKEIVALHQEVARILQEVYNDPDALHEVNAAIYSGFYEDERVLLKDLLMPETSELYQSSTFTSLGAEAGTFKKRFYEAFTQGDYPALTKKLMPENNTTTTGETRTPSVSFVFNSGSPLFAPSTGISIYFPYSDNFSSSFTRGQLRNMAAATIVAADREADEGVGQQPYRCGLRLCYKTVPVNDAYCEAALTHIVGTGAELATSVQANPVNTVQMVFLGNVKCTHQYDKLISFTGNGGGSELRFIRGDGFLKQNAEGQITSPENTISVTVGRKDINKKRWKTVNSIWDANWETDNKEQVFAIYEEDNEGSRTFSGSIETKLNNFTIEPIAYSFTVKTKDDIIRQLNWNRESFLLYNKGQLQNGCGTNNGWTIYDCFTPVSYTLPQQ